MAITTKIFRGALREALHTDYPNANWNIDAIIALFNKPADANKKKGHYAYFKAALKTIKTGLLTNSLETYDLARKYATNIIQYGLQTPNALELAKALFNKTNETDITVKQKQDTITFINALLAAAKSAHVNTLQLNNLTRAPALDSDNQNDSSLSSSATPSPEPGVTDEPDLEATFIGTAPHQRIIDDNIDEEFVSPINSFNSPNTRFVFQPMTTPAQQHQAALAALAEENNRIANMITALYERYKIDKKIPIQLKRAELDKELSAELKKLSFIVASDDKDVIATYLQAAVQLHQGQEIDQTILKHLHPMEPLDLFQQISQPELKSLLTKTDELRRAKPRRSVEETRQSRLVTGRTAFRGAPDVDLSNNWDQKYSDHATARPASTPKVAQGKSAADTPMAAVTDNSAVTASAESVDEQQPAAAAAAVAATTPTSTAKDIPLSVIPSVFAEQVTPSLLSDSLLATFSEATRTKIADFSLVYTEETNAAEQLQHNIPIAFAEGDDEVLQQYTEIASHHKNAADAMRSIEAELTPHLEDFTHATPELQAQVALTGAKVNLSLYHSQAALNRTEDLLTADNQLSSIQLLENAEKKLTAAIAYKAQSDQDNAEILPLVARVREHLQSELETLSRIDPNQGKARGEAREAWITAHPDHTMLDNIAAAQAELTHCQQALNNVESGNGDQSFNLRLAQGSLKVVTDILVEAEAQPQSDSAKKILQQLRNNTGYVQSQVTLLEDKLKKSTAETKTTSKSQSAAKSSATRITTLDDLRDELFPRITQLHNALKAAEKNPEANTSALLAEAEQIDATAREWFDQGMEYFFRAPVVDNHAQAKTIFAEYQYCKQRIEVLLAEERNKAELVAQGIIKNINNLHAELAKAEAQLTEAMKNKNPEKLASLNNTTLEEAKRRIENNVRTVSGGLTVEQYLTQRATSADATAALQHYRTFDTRFNQFTSALSSTGETATAPDPTVTIEPSAPPAPTPADSATAKETKPSPTHPSASTAPTTDTAKTKHPPIAFFGDDYIIKPIGLLPATYSEITKYPPNPTDLTTVLADTHDSKARLTSATPHRDHDLYAEKAIAGELEVPQGPRTSPWFDKTEGRISIIGFGMSEQLKQGFSAGNDPRSIFIEKFNSASKNWTSTLKQLPDTINPRRISVATIFLQIEGELINKSKRSDAIKNLEMKIYKQLFEEYQKTLHDENRQPEKKEVTALLKTAADKVRDIKFPPPLPEKGKENDPDFLQKKAAHEKSHPSFPVSTYQHRANNLLDAYKKTKISRENIYTPPRGLLGRLSRWDKFPNEATTQTLIAWILSARSLAGDSNLIYIKRAQDEEFVKNVMLVCSALTALGIEIHCKDERYGVENRIPYNVSPRKAQTFAAYIQSQKSLEQLIDRVNVKPEAEPEERSEASPAKATPTPTEKPATESPSLSAEEHGVEIEEGAEEHVVEIEEQTRTSKFGK